MTNLIKSTLTRFSLALLAAAVVALSSTQAYAAATIVILNGDAPGVGFNDTTPVAPVGGNPGTTLGQQRLNAFQYAANIWGATLVSTTTITVRATWEPLTCSANSAVLGSAGSNGIWRDFSGATFPGTWYSSALANALTGVDLNVPSHEINARFNVNLGNPDCLTGSPFYLGLDRNHGSSTDLVSVLLHEFSHGLGFQTFTSSSTGVQNSGFPSIYDRFLFDNTSQKLWINMTDAERQASAINTDNLAWSGLVVGSYANKILATPRLTVNSPPAVAGNYQVGTASFGSQLSSPGVTANVAQTVPVDGCTAITNGATINGRIALIDRGNCNFVVKAKLAQDAGAVAVVIADNVAGPVAGMSGDDPTVTIPSVRITQADGNAIKAQLGAPVNATLMLDRSVPGGADASGRPLMHTPNPIETGSSVSHWTTNAFPNQLMEPSISGDLTHFVSPPYDLTTSLFRDIGWVTSNPIDQPPFFVHQHYRDFFNRNPDAGGLAFWTNEITQCGADAACIDLKRTNVSAAFFVSIEFQETGYLVYRLYKVGLGNIPGAPVPVRFTELLPDTQQVGNGVVVNVGAWQARLESNKVAFTQDFVTRPAFITRHSTSLTPAQFVAALEANGGFTMSDGDRTAAINEFGGAGNTADTTARARALRRIAENPTLSSQEFNKAFVLMQYFGYLRRNPYDAPEPTLDYGGYNFWLTKLNDFNGNYVTAEMVRAFIVSQEYRQRFGP